MLKIGKMKIYSQPSTCASTNNFTLKMFFLSKSKKALFVAGFYFVQQNHSSLQSFVSCTSVSMWWDSTNGRETVSGTGGPGF